MNESVPFAGSAASEHDGLPARQRTSVMAALMIGAALSTIDGAIANIALPTIGRDLAASDAATVWIVNGFQLSLAISLLPAAVLGDLWGHKSVYIGGLIVFALASLGCAMSPNLGFLVGARLLQGVGGAFVTSIGPAILREIYPRRLIGRGISLIALTVAVSSAAGPTVAALLLSFASWPWLFLVNLPVCLIAVPLFIVAAPPDARHARPFDLVGVGLNAVALGGLVIGIDTLGGAKAAWGVALLAAGAVALVLLIVQQRRRPLLLPLDLMRIPIFALSFCTSICSYTAQILAYVSLPFLFQVTLHRSQTTTGFLVTPWPVAVACAAIAAGRLSTRVPVSLLGSGGMSILALGLLLLATLPDAPTNLDIVWRMAICGIGFGFFQTPNNIAILTSAPVSRAGAAGAMLAVARTCGFSLGAALVTLLFQLFGARGTSVCLDIACGFAVVGAIFSSARISGRDAQKMGR